MKGRKEEKKKKKKESNGRRERTFFEAVSGDVGIRQTEKTASGFGLISRVFFHTRQARLFSHSRGVKNE